jgi:hypothetical protein
MKPLNKLFSLSSTLGLVGTYATMTCGSAAANDVSLSSNSNKLFPIEGLVNSEVVPLLYSSSFALSSYPAASVQSPKSSSSCFYDSLSSASVKDA